MSFDDSETSSSEAFAEADSDEGCEGMVRWRRRRNRQEWRTREHSKEIIDEIEEISDCLGLDDSRAPLGPEPNEGDESDYPRCLDFPSNLKCRIARLSSNKEDEANDDAPSCEIVHHRSRNVAFPRRTALARRSAKALGVYALCDLAEGDLVEECAYVISNESRLTKSIERAIWIERNPHDLTGPPLYVLVLGYAGLYATSEETGRPHNAGWCFKRNKIVLEAESGAASNQFLYIYATRRVVRGEELILSRARRP